MNRIQNALLVVWVVVLLLFVAFNWQMVWRPQDVVFLFQEFTMPIMMWLVLGGIAAAGTLRVLSEMEVRTRRRRADKEIHAIKSKAFDSLTGEFEKMMSQMQNQLGERIETMLGGQAAASGDTAGSPPPAKDGGDSTPQLSAETTATLAELKSSSTPDDGKKSGEEEAKAKPKRRWRKKKAPSTASSEGE